MRLPPFRITHLIPVAAAAVFAFGCNTAGEKTPADAGTPVQDGGVIADAGTDAGGDAGPPPQIAVLGTWDDNYGSTTIISDENWGSTTIVSFDNDTHSAITQNSADDQYNPSKFNKFVWTPIVDGSFWFCWVDYGLATAEDAESTTKVANASDPANAGCGGFSWTHMTVPLEVKGTWDDNYAGTTVITSFKWGAATVIKTNSSARYSITQNPADDQYNPSKFNKFVWTPIVDGSFWFCWVDYGEETAAAAEATTKVADATDPANSGCGGFGWTHMRVSIEVEGTFDDDYDGTSAITSFTWGDTTVIKLNNTARYAITQNPADDQYNPSKFNKFVWTAPADNQFWFCWVDYGEDTAAAAEATTKVADASDPANGGCGGFSWTHMRTPLSIKGTYDDSLGGSSTITTFKWDTKHILKVNEDASYVVVQNGTQDVNPGKFGKIVWTTPSAMKDFWYCPVATDEDTADAAENTTTVADAAHLDTGGCNGFAWTHLVTPLSISGHWMDGSTPLTISSFFWGDESIEQANDIAALIITRNPQNAAVDPGKYSKIRWTGVTADSFWYCRASSGQDSLVAAFTTGDVDATDPASSGCNGGPWTQLTRATN